MVSTYTLLILYCVYILEEHFTCVLKVSQQNQPGVNQQTQKQLEQPEEGRQVEEGLQAEEKEQVERQSRDKSEELEQQQQVGGIQEQELDHQEGERGQEEKRLEDVHAELAKGKEDKEPIDENSIQVGAESIASPLVSPVDTSESKNETEILDKPASTESHGKYNSHSYNHCIMSIPIYY